MIARILMYLFGERGPILTQDAIDRVIEAALREELA